MYMKNIVSIIENVVIALCSEKQEIVFAYLFAVIAVLALIIAIAASATHMFWMAALCAFLAAMMWPRRDNNEYKIK